MSFEHWQPFLRHVEDFDAGITDWATDAGGRTRFGISSRAHPTVDLDTLTEAGAWEIYERDYYRHYRCHLLNYPADGVLFDAVVNMDATEIIPIFQERFGVKADGLVGPNTAGAINRHWAPVQFMLVDRAGHYEAIARRSPRQRANLDGWTRQRTAPSGRQAASCRRSSVPVTLRVLAGHCRLWSRRARCRLCISPGSRMRSPTSRPG